MNNIKNNDINSIILDYENTKEIHSNNRYLSISNDDFMRFNIDNIFINEKWKKERILCIGRVQSGKTGTIINVIKKAIDLMYDSIIVFAGTNKILLKQSEKRFKDELKDYKEILEQKKYRVLLSCDYELINSMIQNNQKFIICILKADKALTKITEKITSNIIGNKKFLIIDDESDYGTINSNSLVNPSKFYDLLEQMYGNIPNIKLIYVTATPFANILSEKNKLDRPRIVSLKNNEDYWGIDRFNSNNYLCLEEGDESIDYIINQTICIYLFYASKSIIEIDNNKSQLLINISSKVNDHLEYKNSVEYILHKIFDMSDFELEKYVNLILNNFKLVDDLNNYLNLNKNKINEKMRNILNYLINNKSCYALNGCSDDSHSIMSKFDHQIIIGGLMLSRGITFENLICELIINSSKEIHVDVLLQKCRWFGYRGNKSKYMKIIIDKHFKEGLELAKTYVDLFPPGPLNFFDVKEKIISLDKDPRHIIYKIKGTSDGKTK